MWRARFQEGIGKLSAEGLRVDVGDVPVNSQFLLAYQGRNERELQRQIAGLCVAPAMRSAPAGSVQPEKPCLQRVLMPARGLAAYHLPLQYSPAVPKN